MNQDAMMAEPDKNTKNATIEEQPMSVDAVSILNFEMKSVRFIDDLGVQYDTWMLTLNVAHVDEEAWVYFKDNRWRAAIFDNAGEKISEIRESAKPFWEGHIKRDKGVMQDLIKFGFCAEDEVENLLLKIKEKTKENQPLFVDQKNFVKAMESSEEYDADEEVKMSSYAWANYVVSKLHVISDESDMLYTYKGGLFTPDPKADEIFTFYRDTAKDDYKDGVASSIIRQIKAIKRTGYRDFNSDRNIVNFPNGFLNLKTRKLTPHTPDIISTIQLPFPYIPGGKSEKINRILEGILQPEDIKPLKEFNGYSMTTKVNFKVATMFFGEKGTGKTTTQRIITKVIGIDNISGKKLQELSNRFSLYSLKGKTLNMGDELATKELQENAVFKMLTGGSEYVDMEGKHIQSEMMMQTAKLIFSANNVPEPAEDDDGAYYIRWKIISFLNHFDTKDEKTNTGILDDVTDEDYAQFGSECIELFMDVMERDAFTGDAEEDEKIHEYRMLSNPIREFGKVLEPDDTPHGNIKKTMMYKDAYIPWCRYHDIIPVASNVFWKEFKKLGWESGNPRIKGVQVASVLEVKVSEEWDKKLGFTASLSQDETEVQKRMAEIHAREGGS